MANASNAINGAASRAITCVATFYFIALIPLATAARAKFIRRHYLDGQVGLRGNASES
jgi:hypothetical protein